MKNILLSLAAIVGLVGCNSDGGGNGGDDNGGGGNNSDFNYSLTDQNKDAIAGYADLGVSLSISAITMADDEAGRTSFADYRRVSERINTNCVNYVETGNATAGSVTITYNNCSYTAQYSVNGSMAVSWSGSSYDLSGNYTMTFTSQQASFTLAMDPIEASVVDDGTNITTSFNMTFVYDSGTEKGKFTIKTTQDLVAPSGVPESFDGTMQISDGTNTFTITYVDGVATVQ